MTGAKPCPICGQMIEPCAEPLGAITRFDGTVDEEATAKHKGETCGVWECALYNDHYRSAHPELLTRKGRVKR